VRVLVTGSSGLVGTPLCAALRERGDTVDEYDLRPPPVFSDRERFVARDIRDFETLRTAVARADGVVHLAAVSRCAPAEADPASARAINVGGTRNVLSAIASEGRGAWFLFASSREVYGEVDTVPVSEAFPVQPKAVYGRTKADGEAEVHGTPPGDSARRAILRFTNLYGSPWDYPDRVIPAFVSRARKGESLEVRGPGQVLDFLDVRDAVRAILRSVTKLQSTSRGIDPVNIASGEGCTLRGLADRVVEMTHSRSSIHEVAPAAWTPSKFIADISRAKAVLGWEPSIGLSQGLADLSSAYDRMPSNP
jgi:nucleoside-diphosphate-sugar epimerase